MDAIVALDHWFNERIRQASRDEANDLLTQKLALKREMSKLARTEAVVRAAAFLSGQDAA